MKRQPTAWENIFANNVTDKDQSPKYTHNSYSPIKKTQPNQKMERSKQALLQRRHINDQQAYEKMFNTANYQRNANQNYNEVSLHSLQNGYNQEV